MTEGPDKWNLLRVAPCRACGRPAAEGCACGWCGERAPVAPASHADLLFFGIGVVALAVGDANGPAADIALAAPLRPILPVLSALSGWCAAEPLRAARRGNPAAAPVAALAAGAAALLAKLAPAALPPPWFFPAAVLAALALLPAPLPPVPAATARGRLAQRFSVPLLAAAAFLATCAWSFAATGPTALSHLGLGAALCALGRRMRRPAALLVPAAFFLALSAADPGAFALAVAAAAAGAALAPAARRVV
ncbi:MAG: hypothetical protein IJV65_10310 [Kiritimatiellae bacterium]|nr:hypothetical protein [Kiritimatiellia bacterium]